MTGELREFENICGVRTDPSYNWDNLWQMTKLRTMRSQIISPTCSIQRKICDSEYISPRREDTKMESCLFLSLEVLSSHPLPQANYPYPSFSFYHECFQTHIKHKIVVPAKSMSLRNRILRPGKVSEYTFITSAVFIHCYSSFKENIINVESIFSQNIERVLQSKILVVFV